MGVPPAARRAWRAQEWPSGHVGVRSFLFDDGLAAMRLMLMETDRVSGLTAASAGSPRRGDRAGGARGAHKLRAYPKTSRSNMIEQAK
jgi:hypothetical protein